MQPLEREESVGGGHQRGVVVPPEPGAAFVVVEPELAFELLVVELHLPAHACQPCEPLGLGVGGQVGDPVVGWLLLPGRPFGDQPFLARRHLRTFAPPTPAIVIAPAVGSVHPGEDESGGDRFAVGPSRKVTVCALCAPSRPISSPTGTGLRSGRGRLGPRVAPCFLGGTAKEVPCSNTFVLGPTDSTYSHPAWSRRSRNQVFSP